MKSYNETIFGMECFYALLEAFLPSKEQRIFGFMQPISFYGAYCLLTKHIELRDLTFPVFS